jgi:hypothetical protein
VGIFVIPGKSTSVRSTTDLEYTFTIIGTVDMSLFLPHTLSVSISISSLALKKSKYFSAGLCANSIQSVVALGVLSS